MAFDPVTYAVSKKYTDQSFQGKGYAKGEKGDPGPKGPKGDKGDPGENGKDAQITTGTVTSGDTASAKVRTEDGVQYIDLVLPKGEKGDKGDTGETGPAGANGKDGAQGPAGADGIQGPAGPTGPQGPAGKDGTNGKDGQDGKSFTISAQYTSEEAMLAEHPTGKAGDAYLVTVPEDNGDGTTTDYVHTFIWLPDDNKYGDAGRIQGVKGDKGDKGDPGKDGEDGAQGPQGETGPQGRQGSQGLPGSDGADGKDGKDGADGFSPTIDFDTTSRKDGTIVTVHNKDGDSSFLVKNGKDGTGTTIQDTNTTYTLSQDNVNKNKITLRGSDNVSQSVTIPGAEYTLGQGTNNKSIITLTDSNGVTQQVTVPGTEYKAGENVAISTDHEISATDTQYTMTNNNGSIELTDNAETPSKQTVKMPVSVAEGMPTPIGTIIPYMGKTPPSDYLACDGKTYNIADYPELSNFFNAQFGANNYFGGDGTTTFAVPNLNGEFLRGAGTNGHENQGSGGEVGEHQDGTEIPNLGVNVNSKNIWVQSSYKVNADSNMVANEDSNLISSNKNGLWFGNGGTFSGSGKYQYTIRPTNTSVLYCIKALPAAIQQLDTYSTDETIVGRWIDGKPIYRKVCPTTIGPTETGKWFDTDISADYIEKIIRVSTSAEEYAGVDAYISARADRGVIEVIDMRGSSISHKYNLILEYTKTTDAPNSAVAPVTWKATASSGESYDDTALQARVKALEDKLASMPTYTTSKEV